MAIGHHVGPEVSAIRAAAHHDIVLFEPNNNTLLSH